MAALRAGRTGYPDNRGELKFREAVAAKLARDNRARYDPATEILVTTGATLGIYCALTACWPTATRCCCPTRSTTPTSSPIALAGGVPRFVRAPIVGGRFTLTVEALEAAVTPATRVLLLNTPWNPVGTVFTRAELEAIAAFVAPPRPDAHQRRDLRDDRLRRPPARLARPGCRPRCARATILVNSLSKTYAMTGWRVGYCAAPAPIIQAMFLVLQQSSRGPATFIQDAAAAALTGPQDAVGRDARRVRGAARAGD